MTAPTLPKLTPRLLSGSERFHHNGQPLPHDVCAFWRWAFSDLCNNTLRGMLAEYLVAVAVNSPNPMRIQWDACDLQTPEGILVEVKSSAYLQSWDQERLSDISFDVGMKRAWSAATNTYLTSPARSAHVYVFALHAHRDKTTVDPLSIDQWQFFVASAQSLNAQLSTQRRIRLSSLLRLGVVQVPFQNLAASIAKRATPVISGVADQQTNSTTQGRG